MPLGAGERLVDRGNSEWSHARSGGVDGNHGVYVLGKGSVLIYWEFSYRMLVDWQV